MIESRPLEIRAWAFCIFQNNQIKRLLMSAYEAVKNIVINCLLMIGPLCVTIRIICNLEKEDVISDKTTTIKVV